MKKKFVFIPIIVITIIIIILLTTSNIRFIMVVGTSMYPSITQDDIIIIKPIDPETLKIGDIIAYRYNIGEDNFASIHRVIDIRDGIIKTKGDNLSVPDRYGVMSENIVGIMIGKIPYVGYIIRFAGSEIGYIIFILIPAVILIMKETKKILKICEA